MLLEAGIVASLGAIVVLTFVYLRRAVGGAGAGWWAWAWVSVWLAGLVSAFDQQSTAAAVVGGVLGSLFMVFTLAGALAFTGRPIPAWLLPLAVAFTLVRAGLRAAGETALAFGISIPVESALGVFAAAVLLRRTLPGVPRLLPWALLAITAVDAADLTLRALGASPLPTILAWIVGGFTLALLQILALVEQARRDEARSRAALARERGTLRAILDTAPVGVALAGPDGRVRMVNRLAPAHWGFADESAMQGRSSEELAREIATRVEDGEALLAEVQRARRDPDAVVENAEFRLVPPEDRTLDVFSGPVANEADERVGRIFVTRDVTVERRLQDQLRQAQKMETLGTLAGGIAHDFNNQLTAILGNARMLQEGGPGDEAGAGRALGDLERAAEHCAALTRGLLAFSRQAPVQLRPVDPARVLAEVEQLLRPGLPPTVHLEVEADPDLHPVRADATQLQQALLNLAVNARDAVDGSGRIRIAARNARPDPQEGARLGLAAGPVVELEVEDDGAGMDDWTVSRVFDPFFTTKPVGHGTGLGLAIVYGVVRAHGGHVEVHSEPGRGTRFRVRLPASAETPRPTRPGPAPSTRERGGETVLLAEDDARVRRLARRALERAGYRVVATRDGDEAVETFRRDPRAVDVLVCDLSMPGRSGAEVIEAVRAEAPELPAVLVSGHFDEATDRERPGVAHLPKPFGPRDLAARVRAVLDAGREGPKADPPGGEAQPAS